MQSIILAICTRLVDADMPAVNRDGCRSIVQLDTSISRTFDPETRRAVRLDDTSLTAILADVAVNLAAVSP